MGGTWDGWIPEPTDEEILAQENLNLQSELAAAHARIAELERCVVMGGDGKPIGIGQMIWFYSEVWKDWCRVAVFSIKRDGSDIVINDPIGKLKPEDCFSEVPEGDKE